MFEPSAAAPLHFPADWLVQAGRPSLHSSVGWKGSGRVVTPDMSDCVSLQLALAQALQLGHQQSWRC